MFFCGFSQHFPEIHSGTTLLLYYFLLRFFKRFYRIHLKIFSKISTEKKPFKTSSWDSSSLLAFLYGFFPAISFYLFSQHSSIYYFCDSSRLLHGYLLRFLKRFSWESTRLFSELLQRSLLPFVQGFLVIQPVLQNLPDIFSGVTPKIISEISSQNHAEHSLEFLFRIPAVYSCDSFQRFCLIFIDFFFQNPSVYLQIFFLYDFLPDLFRASPRLSFRCIS